MRSATMVIHNSCNNRNKNDEDEEGDDSGDGDVRMNWFCMILSSA
jgi:hypothetical protein